MLPDRIVLNEVRSRLPAKWKSSYLAMPTMLVQQAMFVRELDPLIQI